MGTTPSKLKLPVFNSIFEIFGQFGVWPIIGLQGFDFVNWVSFLKDSNPEFLEYILQGEVL